MRKLALIIIVMFLLSGCFPFTKAIPEGTYLGAKVLKTGIPMIESDYVEYDNALLKYLEDKSDANLDVLKAKRNKFIKGFSASLIAFDKQCQAIIELGE